eukprot:COSAG01_NODE_40328_length_465_cov_0.762295_1_plen_20_part_01
MRQLDAQMQVREHRQLLVAE